MKKRSKRGGWLSRETRYIKEASRLERDAMQYAEIAAEAAEDERKIQAQLRQLREAEKPVKGWGEGETTRYYKMRLRHERLRYKIHREAQQEREERARIYRSLAHLCAGLGDNPSTKQLRDAAHWAYMKQVELREGHAGYFTVGEFFEATRDEALRKEMEDVHGA